MAEYGLLIDYDWCTGCHSCEMACQQENQLPVGQTGILVNELGAWEYGEDTWQLSYLPAPTDQCNLCNARVAKGKQPSCVQHCQAQCMSYGTVEELVARLTDHNKQVLYVVK
jgi:Fe-S-cluster-containing dehydrogenase component